jgi:hypothetical protein
MITGLRSSFNPPGAIARLAWSGNVVDCYCLYPPGNAVGRATRSTRSHQPAPAPACPARHTHPSGPARAVPAWSLGLLCGGSGLCCGSGVRGATTLDHRCGSRAGAGLDPPRSCRGRLHHPARAPHGHHGCHRAPSLAGTWLPCSAARRPPAPGVTACVLVTCVPGRMGMGVAPCTFFGARCSTHHPRPVPDQRAGGRTGQLEAGPASWRPAAGVFPSRHTARGNRDGPSVLPQSESARRESARRESARRGCARRGCARRGGWCSRDADPSPGVTFTPQSIRANAG